VFGFPSRPPSGGHLFLKLPREQVSETGITSTWGISERPNRERVWDGESRGGGANDGHLKLSDRAKAKARRRRKALDINPWAKRSQGPEGHRSRWEGTEASRGNFEKRRCPRSILFCIDDKTRPRQDGNAPWKGTVFASEKRQGANEKRGLVFKKLGRRIEKHRGSRPSYFSQLRTRKEHRADWPKRAIFYNLRSLHDWLEIEPRHHQTGAQLGVVQERGTRDALLKGRIT